MTTVSYTEKNQWIKSVCSGVEYGNSPFIGDIFHAIKNSPLVPYTFKNGQEYTLTDAEKNQLTFEGETLALLDLMQEATSRDIFTQYKAMLTDLLDSKIDHQQKSISSQKQLSEVHFRESTVPYAPYSQEPYSYQGPKPETPYGSPHSSSLGPYDRAPTATESPEPLALEVKEAYAKIRSSAESIADSLGDNVIKAYEYIDQTGSSNAELDKILSETINYAEKARLSAKKINIHVGQAEKEGLLPDHMARFEIQFEHAIIKQYAIAQGVLIKKLEHQLKAPTVAPLVSERKKQPRAFEETGLRPVQAPSRYNGAVEKTGKTAPKLEAKHSSSLSDDLNKAKAEVDDINLFAEMNVMKAVDYLEDNEDINLYGQPKIVNSARKLAMKIRFLAERITSDANRAESLIMNRQPGDATVAMEYIDKIKKSLQSIRQLGQNQKETLEQLNRLHELAKSDEASVF